MKTLESNFTLNNKPIFIYEPEEKSIIDLIVDASAYNANIIIDNKGSIIGGIYREEGK